MGHCLEKLLKMKKEEINAGEEKTNQREAGKCLVLRCGADSAGLALPCYKGGRRGHTRVKAVGTSLSRWNEGTR